MTGRLNLVSDPGLTNTSGAVEERLQDWISGLDPDGYSDLIDPLVRRVLHGAFEWVGGSEGTVWVSDVDEENLVAVYNTGPNAGISSDFVNHSTGALSASSTRTNRDTAKTRSPRARLTTTPSIARSGRRRAR